MRNIGLMTDAVGLHIYIYICGLLPCLAACFALKPNHAMNGVTKRACGSGHIATKKLYGSHRLGARPETGHCSSILGFDNTLQILQWVFCGVARLRALHYTYIECGFQNFQASNRNSLNMRALPLTTVV